VTVSCEQIIPDSQEQAMTSRNFLHSSSQQFSAWQCDYEAVLAESDTHALFKLVEVAEAAALTRLSSLEDSSDHHAEREALAEALAHLLLVKKDRLKFL